MTRLIPSYSGSRSGKSAIDAGRRVRRSFRRVAINDHWFDVAYKLLFLTIATLALFLWTTIDELNLRKKHISIAVRAFEFGSKRAAISNHFNTDEFMHIEQHVFGASFYSDTFPFSRSGTVILAAANANLKLGRRAARSRNCRKIPSHQQPRGTDPPGYPSTVTSVILSPFLTCPILASPTTEPGRRGWKRRLGSPISAPHFFCPKPHWNAAVPYLLETLKL
jgi:hypothetical protein